jgi:hypothetical protein
MDTSANQPVTNFGQENESFNLIHSRISALEMNVRRIEKFLALKYGSEFPSEGSGEKITDDLKKVMIDYHDAESEAMESN